jgi:hypothetical protein
MADNVTLPGTGEAIASDDVGGVQFQRLKLDAGGDGVSAPVVDAGSVLIPTGGRIVRVTASFTRPADTTAYAFGDVVADSTTAPTVITFANCARANGGSGWIVGAKLVDSANQTVKGIFELWLFSAAPGLDNDNAAFTPTDAEALTAFGPLLFSAGHVGDATAGAGGNFVYPLNGVAVPFVAGGGTTSLFGELVVRNAYTPVSAGTFAFELLIQQN